MGIRVVIFLSVVVTIVGAASVYVHRRAARLTGLGRRGRLALGVVLAGGVALMVGSRVLERWAPAGVLEPLGVVGSVVTVGTFIAAILLALVDLAGMLARAASRLAAIAPGGRRPAPHPPATLPRRPPRACRAARSWRRRPPGPRSRWARAAPCTARSSGGTTT